MRWLLLACLPACGFERTDPPPRARLIAPLTARFVATATPTLRFAMPATLTDPVVDLCRDRACSGAVLHATVDAAHASAVPAEPLSPGLWYWRVRTGSPMGQGTSAVWQFRVVPGTSGVVWGGALDVNGDGFDDLAVGAPEAKPPGNDLSAGRVYLYLGGAGGPDPARVTVLDGPSRGGFGFALAAVDFNGDGFSDLAVGAPQFDPGDGSRGAVYLYFGGPDGLRSQPDQTLTLSGASSLGWALDSAGDFNGDGFGDLVVGAPASTSLGKLSGMAYVFNGAEHDTGIFTPIQPEAGDRFQVGSAVAGGCDLDGDGLDDVLVGVPGALPGGHAWMLPGGVSSGGPLLIDVGAPDNALFGYSLVIRGDVDGDGLCDFAVGQPNDGPGHVHLFQGVRGGTPVRVGQLDGPDGDNGRFGTSVAAGDVAGDGSSQLAVGAPCAPSPPACDGRVYLNPGPAATSYDGPSGASYGVGLTLLDADGDGKADLLIGAGEYANSMGRADWFHDAAASPPPRIFNGSDANGRFGYAVR